MRRGRQISVQRQLRKLGVADATYDAIVSSGDLTRHFVADHPGRKVFWLGPERDTSIHRGLDPVLAPLEGADYIICTGLMDDETETAEDYRAMMTHARQRKLPLICANPDIVVERGDRLIYCAGAIAELYRELGGDVIFYGKPHRPIYERAMELASERLGERPKLRPRAGNRRFRPDGSGRRPWLWDRLPVRDARYPCRGFRGDRSARPGLRQGIVRPPAAGADPRTALVAYRPFAAPPSSSPGLAVRRTLSLPLAFARPSTSCTSAVPKDVDARHKAGHDEVTELSRWDECCYALAMSGKTASILVFSVAALNGLTM